MPFTYDIYTVRCVTALTNPIADSGHVSVYCKWCFVERIEVYCDSLSLLQFSVSQDTQAPSQVMGVSLSKEVRQGRPTLRVSWTAPQSNVTISQYHVQFRRSEVTGWGTQVTINPPATSTILSALDPGTEYDVRVRAKCSNKTRGEGEWSKVQTERTFNSKFECSICCYQLHVHLCMFYYFSNSCFA